MKALILSSASLFLGCGFVYSSHYDYRNRNEKPQYRPKLYNKTGEFSYPILPMFSNESQDNIFLSLIFPAYNEEQSLGQTLENTIHLINVLLMPIVSSIQSNQAFSKIWNHTVLNWN